MEELDAGLEPEAAVEARVCAQASRTRRDDRGASAFGRREDDEEPALVVQSLPARAGRDAGAVEGPRVEGHEVSGRVRAVDGRRLAPEVGFWGGEEGEGVGHCCGLRDASEE